MVNTYTPGFEDGPYLRDTDARPIAGAAGTLERDIVLGIKQEQNDQVVAAAEAIVNAAALESEFPEA
jgi:hypothetical protein